MNYLLKSVWLRALLYPSCWKYAIAEMPFHFFLIGAIVLLCLGFVLPMLWCISVMCFILWLCGVASIVVTPHIDFKLVSKEKTLFVYCYGKKNKYVLLDRYFLRIFVQRKNSSKLQLANKPVEVWYDSTFIANGFLLVKANNSLWEVLGNDYDLQGIPLPLGVKLADYCFLVRLKVANRKKHVVKFINGKRIVSFECDEAQKVSDVYVDNKTVQYEPIEMLDESITQTFSPHANKKGQCVLLKNNGRYYFYKMFMVKKTAVVYQVVSEHVFCKDKLGHICYYKLQSGEEGLISACAYLHQEYHELVGFDRIC